jgi:hypothetical protein
MKKILTGTIVCIALIAASTGRVFAAPAPGPTTGLGSAPTNGYAVSDVRYVPASDDPSTIAEVSFALSPSDASRVEVRLVQAGGAWYSCERGATRVTCDTSSSPVDFAAADALDVVASS